MNDSWNTEYPDYQASRVDLLGDIPVVWKVKQIRRLLKDGKDGIRIGPFGSALKLEDMETEGICVWGQEQVINANFAPGNRFISEARFAELRAYEVKPGDLLITMMGSSGRCAVVPDHIRRGIVDSHLLRLRVVEDVINTEFFRRLVAECLEVRSQIERTGKGSIMHGLNSSIVKSLYLPVPPLGEQTQIARFLDHETAKIDALIEKQQQLIDLLEEKRQAVISHAVTKGLDPDVPMRDSGVEWLGKVPAHWTTSSIKRTWNSSDYGISETTSLEGGFEVLTMGDIKDGSISCPGQRFVSDVDEKLLLRDGDLLFNRTNSLALVGKVGIFRGPGNVTFASYCVRIRVSDDHSPEFFNILLNSRYVLASARANSLPSISQTNLNPTRYGDLTIAYPDLAEQVRIAAEVRDKIAKIELTAQKTILSIELLQEKRAALISAAVTGKIDVRDWKPPESESAAETEAS